MANVSKLVAKFEDELICSLRELQKMEGVSSNKGQRLGKIENHLEKMQVAIDEVGELHGRMENIVKASIEQIGRLVKAFEEGNPIP